MEKFSAKNKIIVLSIVWLVLSFAMLFYFFGFLDESNSNLVLSMQQQKKELLSLKAERDNYNQARADLDKLVAAEIQPDDFFSRDVTFVNEIKTLERWAEKLNVNMQLSGISGTVASAPKAKTTTALASIPFGVSLNGTLSDVTAFVQLLEHLNFITNVNSFSITAADPGKINMSLTANFYLRK